MNSLYRKIALRLVPFLMLLYMVAFLDRVNISFAALTMNRDLGISESLYGFAAGVFFLGYCLFEVPANMMLARVGARRWIAMLLVVWGGVSMATAFVPNPPVYVGARFLLGIAEAGFYPGVIFYLTLWLPPLARARIMALFMLAIPICSSIGSPISSHILLMKHISGFKGWQWLFILEGAPAIVLGVVTWFVLADNPRSAPWLTSAEKDELARQMRIAHAFEQSTSGEVWLQMLRDSAAYFLFSVGLYGLSFWLPKILVASGATTMATGWWAALAYAAGAAGMIIAGGLRGRLCLNAAYLIAAVGFAGAALFHGFSAAMFSFSVASAGVFAIMPLFWSASTTRMSSKVAGAAIAVVNSVGAIGGFAGPYAMGWLHDATHSYSAGLRSIAACMAIGAFVASGASPTPSRPTADQSA